MAGQEILLAEDEASIREGLTLLLESEGYVVRAVGDGESVLEEWRTRRPDLLLLDVMMPKRNGFSVCREVRAVDPDLPVLFLTAKADDVDVLRGFDVGADDYMSKTVNQSELLARIAAVLRRSRSAKVSPAAGGFIFGSWRVDVEAMRLVNGEECRTLTVRELEMLRFFVAHPDEVFSRDYLLTRFWGISFEGGEESLTQAMMRLRAKLGDDGERIRTIHRQGYSYRLP